MLKRLLNLVKGLSVVGAIAVAVPLLLTQTASAAEMFYYAEDREDAVATFTATDPDADAGDIEWSVSGVDAEFFEISDDGVLTFKDQPNFEDAKDKDEDTTAAGPQGEGDNVYQVTVVASGGEVDVSVTVTDVDEPGKVTFTQPQPQATRSLEAKGPGDPDGGVDEISWQWSRSESMDGPWADIQGATSAKRNPTTEDIGHYLQATVTYVDVHGDQSVSGVTSNAVEPRTLANAAPEFDEDEIDVISVPENKSGNIGEPIVASDDDNDELLYDLVPSTTAAPNDNALFEVDNNGQLSLESDDGLDYENPGDALGTPGTTRTANAAGTGIEYTVVLRATDPSSASDSVTVTVLLTNVNEAPAFAKDSDGNFIGTTLYIAENAVGPGIFTNDGLTAAVAAYSATDPDGTTLDDAATFTLEGADKDDFAIDGTSGALTTRQTVGDVEGLNANFEDKSSYSITIVAQSTDATPDDADARGTKYARLDVTVKVVDREDTGKVTLSALQSQVNIPVVATHSDEDGGVTDRRWQWYRGGSLPTDLGDLVDDTTGTLTAAATPVCVDADPDDDTVTPTDAATLCRIAGETAALYTPDSDDVGRILHVVADYKDDFVPATREQAGASSDAAVQASNPANTAPKFPDQDLGTPGDQSDVAMRSVAENQDKGTNVGEPIPAGDADRDSPAGNMELLTYTIDDTDNFSVNQKDGQISTAVKLDFETQSTYTVMLTATDPSGATDTITVMISVTDEDDPATVELVTGPGTNAPEFPEDEDGMRSVAENSAAGTEVGAPVAATDKDADDTLTYTLGGADADAFEIDSETGQITVGAGTVLDAETRTEYSVDVTATDEGDNAVTIAVTITVEDVSLPGAGDDHDANSDEMIDRSEAVSAVMAYFDGEITKGAAVEVIGLYFSSGG